MNTILLPAVLGFVAKYYDDAMDLQKGISTFTVYLCRATLIVLTAVMIITDYFFGIAALTAMIASHLVKLKGFDDGFLWILVCVMCVSLSYRLFCGWESLEQQTMINVALCVFWVGLVVAEEVMFPEEAGPKKYLFRYAFLLCAIVAVAASNYLNITTYFGIETFISLVSVGGGYFFAATWFKNVAVDSSPLPSPLGDVVLASA